MKDQLPSPDFDAQSYERPNQKWICGAAADGKSCRVGPDAHGHCRATFECRPALEKKEGEEKGRFRCTRPKEHGGPCEFGPMPDGTCGRAIPKCAPVRSLRAKRGVFTASVAAFTVGALLLALCGPQRLNFISPGELSTQHNGIAFGKRKNERVEGQATCAACHGAAAAGPSGWLQSAFLADPNPLQFTKLVSISKTDMTAIDQSCQRCHTRHNFHQPNVVRDHSCSACHREHLGAGRMPQPDDANCISCHGNASVMEASVEKNKKLSPHDFDYRADLGRILFKPPRPARGYTKILHSFAEDHPEFQIHADKLKENNTLKFNHERHFMADIPLVNGKKLDCVYCHKPDAAGTYHQKIKYEANCKTCHALQFDANNPELVLPHGNAASARAFLRSLPTQYADFATRKNQITSQSEIEKFVTDQMRRIREQIRSGEDLEKEIFFNTEKWGPAADIAHTGAQGPARFSGCARCHEVKPAGEAAPVVTKPMIPDRWMVRGNFNHSKHTNVACARCHQVEHSRETADINLPGKQICVTCHSPAAGVASSCATCHSYHVKGEWLTTGR